MLIPQFSLFRLLATITGCSVAFLIISFAVRGHTWAIGASIGLLSLVVVALLHGFTFFLVWLFARVSGQAFASKRENVGKAIVAFLALAGATRAYAIGGVHTLPAGKPAPNGMILTVDTTWPAGIGYRPVTFSVVCVPPANADRTLSFEFCYHAWNPKNTLLKVDVDLDVPAGAATASTTVAVPSFSPWNGYGIETWEDGRYVKELSAMSLNSGGFGFAGRNDAATPTILFVAANQPDLTTLNALFPQSQYQYGIPQPAPGTPTFPSEWEIRPATKLPEQWLCYQGIDLILISLSDVQNLATSSPKVFSALREWTRAGGNLLVYDVGEDWSGLVELDRLFPMPDRTDAESGKPFSSWQKPLPSHFNSTFTDHVSSNLQSQQVAEVDEQGNPVVAKSPTPPPADAPFRWRTVQQGAVVAILSADPFGNALDQSTWYWVFNTLGSPRWLTEKRVGMNFQEENTDFWNFIIPGVGVAPVDMYRVLITAFVVFIGPVNYLLLRKYGRLHLLLLTVPGSALLVTAALLSYALLADGLHTRVRSRSITLINQRSQEAVSWARLAFYSGLAPSGGLRYDNDTAVIPFEYVPSPLSVRTIEIKSDHQQLSRGWLPSRTPTQFLTVHPYASQKGLKITSDADQATVVENQLGAPIQHLLVCDKLGRFGYGAKLAPGAKSSLEMFVTSSAGKEGSAEQKPSVAVPPSTGAMQKAFADQALALPEGFTSEPHYGLFGTHRRYYYSMMGGRSVQATQATSRLETELAAAKVAVLQAGSLGNSEVLTPGSYIAIVDRPQEIVLGLDNVEETEGFHLIRGNW